jgi:predicted methyltransferase
MRRFAIVLPLFLLAACQPSTETADEVGTPTETEIIVIDETPAPTLAEVLDAQSDALKARYEYRHPLETLEFFGVEPGMTVIEGLPGAGWYTKILMSYLGPDGTLIGATYPIDLWPNFGFVDEEFMQRQRVWTESWPIGAEGLGGDSGPALRAFEFGSMPDDIAGTVDVVFFARVLHNLAAYEDEGGYLTMALDDAFAALKPGGVFGVVQHYARDDMSDEFADGSRGYLKKAFVIEAAENAGFEFVGESDVNENPLDQPAEDDIVWRLPPSLATSREDPELSAQYEAIGESNRMTLKFRKPL